MDRWRASDVGKRRRHIPLCIRFHFAPSTSRRRRKPKIRERNRDRLSRRTGKEPAVGKFFGAIQHAPICQFGAAAFKLIAWASRPVFRFNATRRACTAPSFLPQAGSRFRQPSPSTADCDTSIRTAWRKSFLPRQSALGLSSSEARLVNRSVRSGAKSRVAFCVRVHCSGEVFQVRFPPVPKTIGPAIVTGGESMEAFA